MRRYRFTTTLLALLMVALPGAIGWRLQATPAIEGARPEQRARGEQLVRTMGCHDCHTPWKNGPRGPEPDMSRALTGHPAGLVMPTAPSLPPGPWQSVTSVTRTAWAGPWGVSYTTNLTPDKETGLGTWTAEMFLATMKTGRHQGTGRLLLPPMPYASVAALKDEDIRSLFAYLQSLQPVHNRVPQPVEPNGDL